MSDAKLNSVTPILFVRDVPAAAAYWRDACGFAVDFLYGEPAFYGSASRDGVCLHLRSVDAPNFADLAAREESLILALIETSDVHALHAELVARGARIAQAPTAQAWGGVDFHVRDLDGNVVAFVTYG